MAMTHALLRHFYGGFIRLHLLYHAGKEPICGIEMIAELLRHGYRIGPGTLYPILHDLEQAGYLISGDEIRNGKRRKNYRLTRRGRTLLRESRAKLAELTREVLHDKSRMSGEGARS